MTTPPLAHLFIAGAEDEVGERLGKGALGEGVEAFVQALVDGGDGRGREGMAAQLLGDRLDLAGRDALHVHLGQRRHQGLFRALVAFEQFDREPTIPILRHAELELAHPGDEGAAIVPGAVALFGPDRVSHLGFQHLLHHRAREFAQPIRALGEKLVDGCDRGLSSGLGHGGGSPKRIR
jgi:hypothetical protein